MIEKSCVFGTQKEQKYSFRSNICYHLRTEWEGDKRLLVCQCAMVAPTVLGSFLGALLPSEAVRGLEDGWGLERLVLWLALLTGIMWACHVAGQGMKLSLSVRGATLQYYYREKCFRKMMHMDYDVMERQQAVTGNVWKALRYNDDFESAAVDFTTIAVGALSMAFYGVLIARKNLFLLLSIAVTVLIKTWLLRFARRKHREEHAHLSRYAKETAYISKQSRESVAGKDIRIYQMADLFMDRYEKALKGMDRVFHKIHDWYLITGFAGSAASLGVNAFSYLYLTYLVSTGDLSASEFVLYVALVTAFAECFHQMNRSLLALNPFCASISYIREFLELPDRWPDREKLGAEGLKKLTAGGVKIEFKDVSYTYAGKTEPTLSHINLTIRPGEKLALLGLNGAGKTTMVKLLCGFYEPAEGCILLNDIPITNFNREEYFGLMAVLFQDSTMLPFSLDENLTGQTGGEVDRKRLESAMGLSGFAAKYDSLSEKGDTLLVKEANKGAVDFSGGEKQKLLFARALYKGASILILDEPTAALDPIAENELYRNFGEAANGRTTVYISHRLSSTRFCDRIVLLENGRIIEEGSHKDLMDGDTRYARLYEIQSQYYREEKARRKRAEDMGDVHAGMEEEKRKAAFGS